jgi:hypothetical protein
LPHCHCIFYSTQKHFDLVYLPFYQKALKVFTSTCNML